MKRLKDKVALITGGSSGIGLATARLMREEGANVVIVGRDREKLSVALHELGDHVCGISADVSSLEGIGSVLGQVCQEYGRIDVLFANAGMSGCPPLWDTDEAFFDRIMNTNVKSVFFLFTQCFSLFSESASVILTSSVAHRKGRPGDPLYSATKAAVRSLGRTLAMDEEVLARKIRVNVVSPGAIRTPLTRQHTPEMEQALESYIQTVVPMRRWGQAEEVARAVLFLASSDSAYMTGGELIVDGGLGQQ